MAKQTLPTNFKDDILSSSMGGKRKYRIIDNGDGTYSFEDVTEYTQNGSDFGAGQINATNQAVNESCDKANVIDDLDDIVANQADGMIAGAKAVATLNADLAELYDELNKPIEEVETSYGMAVLHKKIGNLHTIRIAGNITGELTTHSFSIPKECSPTQFVYFWTRVNATWCQISITSEGVVTISADTPISVGNYINIWVTYA